MVTKTNYTTEKNCFMYPNYNINQKLKKNKNKK